MKKHRILSFLTAMAMISSVSVLSANADDAEKDGISVSYSTDSDRYTKKDAISTVLKVTNNNHGTVRDIELAKAVPEGYCLADGVSGNVTVSELKSGESAVFETVFIPMDNGRPAYTANLPANPNGGLSIVSGGSAPATPSAQSNSSQPTNTVIANTGGSNSDSTIRDGMSTAQTAIICALSIVIIAGLILLIKLKKGKKLFSFLLAVSLTGAMLSGSELKASAAGRVTITVSADVVINGSGKTLTAFVRYDPDNIAKPLPMPAEPTEADKYYFNNSDVYEVKPATADEMFSETEVIAFLKSRGFDQSPVTYDFTATGESAIDFDYDDEGSLIDTNQAFEDSSEKHPVYRTNYISDEDEYWSITVVGKTIAATPVYANLDSGMESPIVLSEYKTVTSYYNVTNTFYINSPYSSATILKTVNKITAESLDSLSSEGVIAL